MFIINIKQIGIQIETLKDINQTIFIKKTLKCIQFSST